MNYYDFHIGDYASRTAHLSPLEDIAYRRLLDLYYTRESALPLDVQQVARLIRMRGHEDDIALVLGEFFEKAPDGWMHRKCEEVIQAFREKSGKASKSAKARWEKERAQEAAMQTQSEGNANASKTDANACKTDANALRPGCEGNAPSTQYPVPTTHSSTADAVGKAPRKKREPSADAVVSLSVADLAAEGVDPQHAADWFKSRKDKGAKTLTPTAWNAVKVEAAKAGMTPADAVKTAAEQQWQGFKASWLSQPSRASPPFAVNKQEALEARNKAVAEEWLREQGVSDAGIGQGEILDVGH